MFFNTLKSKDCIKIHLSSFSAVWNISWLLVCEMSLSNWDQYPFFCQWTRSKMNSAKWCNFFFWRTISSFEQISFSANRQIWLLSCHLGYETWKPQTLELHFYPKASIIIIITMMIAIISHPLTTHATQDILVYFDN